MHYKLHGTEIKDVGKHFHGGAWNFTLPNGRSLEVRFFQLEMFKSRESIAPENMYEPINGWTLLEFDDFSKIFSEQQQALSLSNACSKNEVAGRGKHIVYVNVGIVNADVFPFSKFVLHFPSYIENMAFLCRRELLFFGTVLAVHEETPGFVPFTWRGVTTPRLHRIRQFESLTVRRLNRRLPESQRVSIFDGYGLTREAWAGQSVDGVHYWRRVSTHAEILKLELTEGNFFSATILNQLLLAVVNRIEANGWAGPAA